jgi:hypothetical protein
MTLHESSGLASRLSDAKLKTRRDSLTKTQSILTSAGLVPEGDMLDFRPPYGQRSVEITDFVGEAGGKVLLDPTRWRGPGVRLSRRLEARLCGGENR